MATAKRDMSPLEDKQQYLSGASYNSAARNLNLNKKNFSSNDIFLYSKGISTAADQSSH
jgi:hypothetical protein